MRTLRLTLVAVALALPVGGNGAVVAQDEAVHFSGTTTDTEIVSPPEVSTSPEGVMQVRDVVGVQTLTMGDDRFSGTETFVHSEDHYGDVVGPVWGTSRIENDGGAWVGTYRGVMLPDGSATYLATYAGEDGYEGLSVTCASTSDGVSGFSGECVLFPGSVPDIPPAE